MATIMLTLDGSPLAEQAVGHAVARCTPGDELVLLYVLDQPATFAGGDFPIIPPDPAPCEAYLQRIAEKIDREGVTVRTEVIPGMAAPVILARARKHGAQLLVMASHGRSGWGRWLMGSVAERVVREAPCPVWLVRESSKSPAAGIRRVLVPLDPDDTLYSPLRMLTQFVVPGSAEILLLSTANLDWIGSDELRRQLVAEMYKHLEGPAAILKAAGWDVQLRAFGGDASGAIVETAQDEDIDLIVMATHGRQGMQHLFSGSVAEQVARHAHCPVVIVPPPVAAIA